MNSIERKCSIGAIAAKAIKPSFLIVDIGCYDAKKIDSICAYFNLFKMIRNPDAPIIYYKMEGKTINRAFKLKKCFPDEDCIIAFDTSNLNGYLRMNKKTIRGEFLKDILEGGENDESKTD